MGHELHNILLTRVIFGLDFIYAVTNINLSMSNNFLLKKPVESYEFVISSDIADILTAVYFTD